MNISTGWLLRRYPRADGKPELPRAPVRWDLQHPRSRLAFMTGDNSVDRARAVIDFSTLALRNKGDLDGLLAEASRCVADGLGVARAKVLEWLGRASCRERGCQTG